MKNNLICSVLISLIVSSGFSQNQTKNEFNFKPNAIHLNPGTGIPFALYVSGLINYDRILKENLYHKKINLFARASFGGTVNWRRIIGSVNSNGHFYRKQKVSS